jgi:hypothetical protein
MLHRIKKNHHTERDPSSDMKGQITTSKLKLISNVITVPITKQLTPINMLKTLKT